MATVACGGGHPVAKDAYLRKGNAICSAGEDRVSAIRQRPDTYIGEFVGVVRQEIRDLRALGYPRGDRGRLDAIFTEVEMVLHSAETNPSTLDANPFEDVNHKLTAYGLTVCGT